MTTTGRCLRCQMTNITTNNTCKNKTKMKQFIFGKRACSFHYNYYLEKYSTKIQSIYRGYRCRKYLINVYVRVPYDVQNIIQFYINEELYIDKYINTLTKIVVKKMAEFICFADKYTYNYGAFAFQRGDVDILNYSDFIYYSRDEILDKYRLYFKYERLFQNNKFPTITHALKIFKDLLTTSLYYFEKKIYNSYTNHIFEANAALSNILDKYYKH